MRRIMVVLTMGVLGFLPRSSAADGVEVRLGAFLPRADSGARSVDRFDFHKDLAELYTVGRSDWTGISGGIEYTHRVYPHIELGLHVDGYSRANDTIYREYTHQDDRDISQTHRLNIVPFGLSVKFVTSDRRGRSQAYVAAGGDLFAWQYDAWGELVDFTDPELDISYGEFRATGVAPGFHAAVGARIALSYDFSLTAEGRYQWAEDDMGGGFSKNRLDLSGATFTLGLYTRF
jgi:hypothetical protein